MTPDEPIYIYDGFPLEEQFPCWDNTIRTSTITCQKFPEFGYLVEAWEKDKAKLGYAFAAGDPEDPQTALDTLRQKIVRRLSSPPA